MNAHRELQVPGARLRYRDEGAGRAVVFVHGWTLDLDVWEPQATLAAELRVVRYDRRGFGLSTGQPSLTRDVSDLGTLLSVLGIVSPLLVGMSQGARVVLEFAARHPGLRARPGARRRAAAARPFRPPVPRKTCRWNRCASWRRAMASRHSAAPGACIR